MRSTFLEVLRAKETAELLVNLTSKSSIKDFSTEQSIKLHLGITRRVLKMSSELIDKILAKASINFNKFRTKLMSQMASSILTESVRYNLTESSPYQALIWILVFRN